jgi:hypothetical protein
MGSAPDGAIKSRIATHNTLEHTFADGSTSYQLHDTEIVRIHPDGSVTLNSGGWQTCTTKDRINNLSPLGSVHQKKGLWYVTHNDKTVPYYDGITLREGQDPPSNGQDKHNQTKRQLRQIAAYTRAIHKQISSGQAVKPDKGDCWYCQQREVKTGKPLGEVTQDREHIQSHLDEKHIVGSLVLQACISTGCDPLTCHAVATGDLKRQEEFLDLICSAVRRYIKRQLGIG